MTTRLQQSCVTDQMSQVDCRKINILTILSKLAMVMVLCVVAIVIALIS